ncbi:ATP-dependent RNA helicase DDX42 [Paragonimus westermani]|uniref:RNA helicase n=1 Tax=Paragonimus westermani TaxID=34504 RepID=A0A5J4N976_9TREM|nr:ATP-dependent RNA helicase DDX42 [Paragonimus westermani]
MSHGKQRGGRWGMNFISASGPHSSLSHSKLQDDRPGDYFRSGYSSSALAADGVRGVGAAVPPPSSLSRSSRGYSDPNEVAAKQISMVPGHGSSSSSRTFANLGRKRIADDEEGIRDDIEQEDEVESYMRFMEENPHLGLAADEDEEVYEYDAEGNIIGAEKKMIDPLPPIDHSTINYSPFAKNFYVEHEDISKLDDMKVAELREKLGIRVSGPSPLRPVCAFAHLRFDEPLLEAIRKAGFTKPTPIQAQAVPLAMAGRDVIGIGKTGSGKTAAFLWPAIIHIMDQPPLKLGDGPICVICAPTRELAQQIYSEAKKLARVYNLTVVCAYGGGSLWEQQKACEAGCEILICTPGRLIDLVKKKSTNLRRVTYLVFDEADKMFNLGFDATVDSASYRPTEEELEGKKPLKEDVRHTQTEPKCTRRLSGNRGCCGPEF